jgi:Cdc6-like AAA superfamily ATPase
MQEYFCLKDRQNFDIHPEDKRDRELFFGKKELHTAIEIQIRKAFATAKPLKIMLWGDWGVGKTHVIRHIEFYLEKHEAQYPSAAFFMDCPDVEKNTRFDTLHGKILDCIGLERVQSLLAQFNAQHGLKMKSVLQAQVGGSSEIASALQNLLVYGPIANTAWSWLKGVDVKAQGVAIGVSAPLSDSQHFADILRFIGRLFKEFEKKQLIILLDEMQKLQNVSDVNAVRHWVSTLKELADNTNNSLGFVLGLSFRDEDQIPEILYERQIISRLSPKDEHIIPLPNYEKVDVEVFLNDMLKAFIDASSLKAKKIDGVAGFDADTYPFTRPAFDEFVDLVSRNPNESVPRQIISKLGTVAWYSMDGNKPIIDSDMIKQIEMTLTGST